MTNATEKQMEYLKDLFNKMQNGDDINARICKLMVIPSALTKDQASELINIFKNNPYHKILLSALKNSTVMPLMGEKFNATFNAMSSAKSKEEAVAILESAEKAPETQNAEEVEVFSMKGKGGYKHVLQNGGNYYNGTFFGDMDEYIKKTVMGGIHFHCLVNALPMNDDAFHLSIYNEWLKTGEYEEIKNYLLAHHSAFD